MRIYVASSWRNKYQPTVVAALRGAGHEVYDFRNPPDGSGFGWEQLDPQWQSWSVGRYCAMLNHPIAQQGFDSDFDAMKWTDTCVLVLPSGRSAHLEAGWFIGQRKPTIIFLPEPQEPELMYRMADTITDNLANLLEWLAPIEDRPYRHGGKVL